MGLSRLPKLSGLSVVPHWKACIVLAVYELSGCRNRSSRHNLSDENNSPSIIAAFLATNVEAQVYLLELGVKQNWETPEQFSAAEAKAHKADVCSSVERIQRRTGGNVSIQKTGFNLVVQHHELSPFSRKENSFD
jgi:hypothetical protein